MGSKFFKFYDLFKRMISRRLIRNCFLCNVSKKVFLFYFWRCQKSKILNSRKRPWIIRYKASSALYKLHLKIYKIKTSFLSFRIKCKIMYKKAIMLDSGANITIHCTSDIDEYFWSSEMSWLWFCVWYYSETHIHYKTIEFYRQFFFNWQLNIC